MTDDFTPLASRDHFLGWTGDDPAQAVRREIEGLLTAQIPAAQLVWVRLLGEPRFLTSVRKDPRDPDMAIITRAALAIEFDLEVDDGGNTERLKGVFSWVAKDMDRGRRDSTFLDLDMGIDEAENNLKGRMFEVDSSSSRQWWQFWRRKS